MLIAGGTTAAAGLTILGHVLWNWSARGFGPTSSVVPAVLGTALVTIGFQNALWGFFMSVIAGNEAAFDRAYFHRFDTLHSGLSPSMGVLMVSQYFESHRGGIEIVAGRLARELAALGHYITSAATDGTPPPDGFPATPLGAWNGIERRSGLPMPVLGPAAVARLICAMRNAHAVIAHDGAYLTTFVTLLVARAFGKPVILIQHTGALPQRSPAFGFAFRALERVLVRPVLAATDQAVFISDIVRQYCRSTKFRCPPRLIFNGCGLARFHPLSSRERAQLRAGLGLQSEDTVALFVGRFVEKKGLHHVEAAARLLPNVRFRLAGWRPIDPGAWNLLNVRTLGAQGSDGIARLYCVADLLVLPSVGEGLPLVIQEALASGLPVICGDDTAAADPALTLHLHAISLQCPDQDETGRALAEALRSAPPQDTETRTARAAVAQRYNWPAITALYEALLTTLTALPEPIRLRGTEAA